MKENSLIKKCQKGDRPAFEELIRIYYPYVLGFLHRTIADDGVAEDLTQETFLKVIRNIDKYDTTQKSGFGTWIITIARNSYIDYLRRNRMCPENIDEIEVAAESNTMERVIRKLQYEEAMEAVNKLPYDQRIVIKLKYEEDLTLEQIAKRLGIKAQTVKSRIHDGMVKLRRTMKINERNGYNER